MMKREFYIPKGSLAVCDKRSDAIAYIYETARDAKPAAMVFYGKQSKPVAHHSFRDNAARESAVARLFAARQQHAARIADNRAAPSAAATRNRDIKRVLEGIYGRGTVRVTGGRGTAYGWVSVRIAVARPDGDSYHESRAAVLRAILDAGISIGRYDSSDYGSGYELTIDFAGAGAGAGAE